MAEDGLFEVKDETKLNEATPLVSEPYTYENMVNNPVIKPIAECDRSLRDMDEIEYKTLIDIKKLKEKINSVMSDVPSYQDTTLIAELIRLTQLMDYVIKIEDIKMFNTKECIKKVFDETKKRYYIKLEDREEYVEPETIIPEGTIEGYLDKLIAGTNENHGKVATAIKEIFLKTTKGTTDQEKFQAAGLEYYGKELDKNKRQIAARMIRMEI